MMKATGTGCCWQIERILKREKNHNNQLSFADRAKLFILSCWLHDPHLLALPCSDFFEPASILQDEKPSIFSAVTVGKEPGTDELNNKIRKGEEQAKTR